jgi:steroid 5-alpha reductase family enzyme
MIMIFLTAGAVIFGLMFILWIFSLLVKNASIVDIFWDSAL